ncbi:hypothetical protein BSL78_04555 [Apostichopus japonicus]|uniref:Death domain-containing protein n=1 Tax=Stichopus japonicus TaxID=307972 RepID=A0A2G8LE55_STIJA|nr:hypothetical protein BSL78_04555 [Apostichopus japonicus]
MRPSKKVNFTLLASDVLFVSLQNAEMEGNEIMTDARINDFKFWVLKNKDRPEVDLLPKFCTPEKLEKMITSCWNHELSSRNSFEHWVGTLEDQYNTYTEEEIHTAKKALETAVTAVICDEDLPQIPSQSININDIIFLNQLGHKLDPPSVDGNDWHKLADELGFKVGDIDLIESRESNPTKAVLQAASHKGADVSPKRLIEIATKMKRTDVVNVIQNRLQPTETERLDATDSSTLTVFEIHELKVFEVLRVLDVASELGYDWKALAGKLDFTPDKINKIQQACNQKRKSPTDVVLKAACQQAKLKSYQHLIELLTEILRPDVAIKLKQVL